MSNNIPPFDAPAVPTESYPHGNGYQGAPQLQPEPKYNVLAIISLVSAFVVSLAAIITGHIALSQIKRTGEKGRGLALAGVILGYVGIVAGAVMIVVMIMVGISAGQAAVDVAEQQEAIAQQKTPVTTGELPTDSAQGAGTVSPEFCAVLTEGITNIAAANEEDRDAASSAVFKALASAPGPNQAAYSDFYEFMLAHGHETGALPEEVAAMETVVGNDIAACQTLAAAGQ